MSAYLYIFEDGTALQSTKPPSEDDQQTALSGYLQVYRWNGAALEQLECTEAMDEESEEGEESTSLSAEWVAVPARK